MRMTLNLVDSSASAMEVMLSSSGVGVGIMNLGESMGKGGSVLRALVPSFLRLLGPKLSTGGRLSLVGVEGPGRVVGLYLQML